jgi:hypothetical protein
MYQHYPSSQFPEDNEDNSKNSIFVPSPFLFHHMLSGWWFQTFFIFYNIWDNPSH